MKTIEERLSYVEDRLALEDAVTRYCTGVDGLKDLDALLDCFAEDPVLDLTGIALPKFEGKDAVRGFFTQVFGDMTHHGHFTTNFVINKLEGDTANCNNYVMGMGRSRDGNEVLVYVKYDLDFVKENGVWKIKNFSEATIMPLPESVTAIHGR